jgi:hypothetical protein
MIHMTLYTYQIYHSDKLHINKTFDIKTLYVLWKLIHIENVNFTIE